MSVRTCPIPVRRSHAALVAEAAAIEQVLRHVADDDWGAPTGLPAWSVRDLAAHLLRGVTRVGAYLAAPEPHDVELDWLSYWQAASDLDPHTIAARATELASRIPSRDLPGRFSRAVGEASRTALDAPRDRTLPTPLGSIRLDAYLTTRVVELVVHGLDLRRALGLEQVATPGAIEVTALVLDGLLALPRPVDLERDDIAFILAATGRHAHPDPDLPVLG